jgi:uncharacterized protein YraI
MGHPKLSPADNVLRPDFPQNPQQEDRLPDAEDLAVARIAERFAPNVQLLATPNERKFYQPTQRPVSSFRLRALVTLLIIVALLPSLIVGTMLWLGLVGTPMAAPFGGEARSSIQSASVTGMPVPPRHKSDLSVALAAPVILEAKAGGDVSFALALSDIDGLPTHSIIAIHGLPHGSALSSGRPYGEGGWNLRPEEIAGLRLTLPEESKGEATLQIRLITPGGETVASAETRLKVTTKPDTPNAITAHGHDEHQLDQGVRSFVTDAIESDGSNAMLTLGAADDAITASRRGSTAEPPDAPTAEQPQEITSNTAAAKPGNQEAAEVEGATKAPAQHLEDKAHSHITLSEFVNLREGPSSSKRVIGVMEKGSKLRVIGRKRAWLKVTDAASSQTGWIYSRYAYSARKSRRAMQEATPSRLGSSTSVEPESDASIWTSLEHWVVGP